MDPIADICTWIAGHVRSAGCRGAVVGLSGGLDSAVVAALCARALPGETLGLILPCHSLEADTADARRIAEFLGIESRTVDLSPVYDALVSSLPPAPRLVLSNIKPRLRMTVLYYFAGVRGALVAGTGNRSEREIGYFTKFGDGGADLLPLGNLLKREVCALARSLGLPPWVIARPPSAGLWEGQTDEGEMGVRYEDLDRTLECLAAGREPDVPSGVAGRVRAMMAASEHKRRPIPIYEPGGSGGSHVQ